MNEHPHLFLAASETEGLRSVPQLRRAIRAGRPQALWSAILQHADSRLDVPPYTPLTPLPGRPVEALRHANRDAGLTVAVGNRLLNSALAFLVTEKEVYLRAALRQIDALFDESLWPDWRDLAPSHQRMPADLRTGYLGKNIGIAFDWLYPGLAAPERERIAAGMRTHAFNPFWQCVDQQVGWVNGRTNWMTCIVGGLGIAAMAMDGHVMKTGDLIEMSNTRMTGYLAEYGPDGEFNESPGYSTATRFPVEYALARLYHTRGADNPLARWPFPHFCRWFQHMTLPDGSLAPFGDTHPGRRQNAYHFAAIAQAARDPLIQWQYLQLAESAGQTGEPTAFELLWYDDSLAPEPPGPAFPLGCAFPTHSGCVASRSSWTAPDAVAVVGKAGHGREQHGHHDAGSLVIHAAGETLITEPGIPPSYPADFFGPNRYAYYNAAAFGHNVLLFDGREMRVTPEDRARFLESRFDNRLGAAWTVDTTALYDRTRAVRRTVIHLLPGVVAVLDQAVLDGPATISLRWHTLDQAEPGPDGAFVVRGRQAALAAQFAASDHEACTLARRGHAYTPPHDKGRLGDLLTQKHESFVEIRRAGTACRWLTLFAVLARPDDPARWTREPAGGWSIPTPDGPVLVRDDGEWLTAAYAQAPDRAWRVAVPQPDHTEKG